MAETKIETKAPKRGRWLRWLGLIAGAFVVLVVALYFIGTSSAFVKGVIVPRVGTAMNADIAVGDAQVSPFKSVVLRDVKLTPKGAERLFTAAEVRLRYSLMSIIGGKIAVEEMTVVAPTVTLVEKANGSSNLDPLMQKKKPAEKSPPSKPGSPPSVDVKSVALNNATIRRVKELKGGGRDVFELANVNITASNIKNGQAGKFDLAASISIEKAAQPGNAGGSLQAKLKGGFIFDLASDLKPKSVKGDTTFTVEKATGELLDLSALSAKLDCEATPTEVKQLALRFTRANASLGELRVSGPLDSAKTEGKLKVEILSLDRQVLNLAGAASGLDFGTTTINSSSEIELAKGGNLISVAGQLDVARFQIIRQKQASPTLDLRCDYNVTVNCTEQTASLKAINLAGTQDKRPLIKAELTSPMTIAWGNASSTVGDAALNLSVTGLNLADWKAFAPEAALEGKADAKVKLLSKQGGKQLTFEIEKHVENLSARFGSNEIKRTDVRLVANGQATDLKQFKLNDYRLEVSQQGQAALTVSGSGTFDKTTQDADLQVVVQATLTRLLALFPQPDAKFTGGTIDFKGRVTSKKQDKVVTGELVLADLSGAYGSYRFASYGTWINLDVATKGNLAEIRKASGHVRESQNAGGAFEASGNLDLERKAGQIKLGLTDFNQNGLRPFLESALGDKKLVSVRVSATTTADIAANGDAAIKADLQVANLVVNDPKGALPTTPLEARVQVDTTVANKVAQLRQCQLTLTPTDRAKNQLGLTGTVDSSKTNAITGNLKLAAESLDVTRYYDLFAGKPATTSTAAKPGTRSPQPAPARAPSDKEPDAVNLPFRNFTFEVNVGRFYLQEVDIAKLQTSAKLDGGHLVLKPCQLTLNGAPVNADVDLDLGMPGYRYDVTFNAQAVPLAPLVNSFQPDRKGQIGGHLTATAQLKGAGTTGASLQKNLSGKFDVASTNLNLLVVNVKSPLLKTVINVIAVVPEILKNPTAAPGALLGAAFGGSRGGLVDELSKSPIDVIEARGDIGTGVVNLQRAFVQSPAFQSEAAGTVTLAEVLTNSTLNIPLHVWLQRGIADRLNMVPSDTPTNAAYAKLPDYVTIKGTVGEPKSDINKLALLGTTLKSIGKSIPGVDNKAGDLIQGLGGLLTGQRPQVTNPASGTNQAPVANNPPPTNRAIDLLDLFKKPKK